MASGGGGVRFVRRHVSAPGSVAEGVECGENPAGLFRAVIGQDAEFDVSPDRVGRLSSEAFVASSGTANSALDAILAGEGRFVSTGQQPGLFLGPLYTVYKLITAINLAARLEKATGVPHLAVFWVASDDHDWDEVATCSYLASDESIAWLSLSPDSPGASVGQSVLSPDAEDLVTELATGLGLDGSSEDSFIRRLRSAYREGQTAGGAFVEVLRDLLGDADFVMLDSANPLLRRAASEFYRGIIEEPTAVLTAMASGRSAVEAAGFPVQLTPPANGVQVFADTGEGRSHVLATDGRFATGSGMSWSAAELKELICANPNAFTPAAGLRPVLESWLLPVGATVLGPGEAGYWAQLRPLFEALHVPMPTVALRDGWHLVEPRVERLLKKLDTNPEEVETRFDELRENLIARGRPVAVDRSLGELRRELEARLDGLEEAGKAELPGLAATVSKARKRIQESLEDLRRAVDGHAVGRQETVLRQLDRLRANLVPGGAPQERALGSAGFMARYGQGLLRDLLEDVRVAGTRGQD